MVARKFIGVKELAEYLGIKIDTLYSWIYQRKIPYVKVGRLVKFDSIQIDEWISKNSVKEYARS